MAARLRESAKAASSALRASVALVQKLANEDAAECCKLRRDARLGCEDLDLKKKTWIRRLGYEDLDLTYRSQANFLFEHDFFKSWRFSGTRPGQVFGAMLQIDPQSSSSHGVESHNSETWTQRIQYRRIQQWRNIQLAERMGFEPMIRL